MSNEYDMASDDLRFLLTRSRARVDCRSSDAAEIYLSARRNNQSAGVTGFLHREDDIFVQYLEGRAPILTGLLAGLRRDWRHGTLEVLRRDTLHRRLFRDWDMAVADHEMRSYRLYQTARGATGDIAEATADQLTDFFAAMAMDAARPLAGE